MKATKNDPIVKYLEKVFQGMPCSNRVSAAEKAAFDRYLEKGRARRHASNLRTLEKLSRGHKKSGG